MEGFPIFQAFQQPVIFQVPSIIFILPTLEVLYNIDDLGVFFPSIVDYTSELIDNSVQTGYIWLVGYIEISDKYGNLFDKGHFLLTIFGDRAFGYIDAFFNDRDRDGKKGMVWC